jgi:hypothetical protein
MAKPTLIKSSEGLLINKSKSEGNLFKEVLEYNSSNQFDSVDIAYTKVNGTYPSKGLSGNDKVTMLYYILSGSAEITLEIGESFFMEKADVFILPPKTFYKISGDFEALMICSPAWYESQSIKKLI